MTQFFDKHRDVGNCRRLNVDIDIERLQGEVAAIPGTLWSNNRAPVHRETVSLFLKGHPPLLGIAGDPDQPILSECPYIRELLYELMHGTPGKCLLAALMPAGIVYPHTDVASDYFRNSIRIHIPVFTNPEVRFFCDGKFYYMPAGGVWAVNNLAAHAVVNEHPREPRIHLIYDIFPDRESLKLLTASRQETGKDDERLLELLKKSVSRPAGVGNNQNS